MGRITLPKSDLYFAFFMYFMLGAIVGLLGGMIIFS